MTCKTVDSSTIELVWTLEEDTLENLIPTKIEGGRLVIPDEHNKAFIDRLSDTAGFGWNLLKNIYGDVKKGNGSYTLTIHSEKALSTDVAQQFGTRTPNGKIFFLPYVDVLHKEAEVQLGQDF